MAFDLKKTLTDTSAIYALVGAADEAVDQVKSALDQAVHRTASLRSDLDSKSLQAKVTDTVADVRSQVEALPATATERFAQLTGEFDKTYEKYATRGEKLVRELRTRPEVERLSERTGQVAEQAQAAVETVRKVAEETQSAALGAVYSTRKQAAQETVKVAETVQSEAVTSVRSNAAKEGAAKKTASERKTSARKAPAKKTTARKTTAKKSSTGKASAKKSDQA